MVNKRADGLEGVDMGDAKKSSQQTTPNGVFEVLDARSTALAPLHADGHKWLIEMQDKPQAMESEQLVTEK
jgi:hypothetical protein